jgi:hypothetical protein
MKDIRIKETLHRAQSDHPNNYVISLSAAGRDGGKILKDTN